LPEKYATASAATETNVTSTELDRVFLFVLVGYGGSNKHSNNAIVFNIAARHFKSLIIVIYRFDITKDSQYGYHSDEKDEYGYCLC
jgi:hypothetical protein